MPKPIPAWLEKAQDLLKNHSLTEDNASCIYDQVLTQLRDAEVRVKQLSELISELPDPTLSEILAERLRQSLRATWSNRATQLCDVEIARATYDQVLTQLRDAEVRVKQLSELIRELPDPTLSEILAERLRQSLRATWSNRATKLYDVEIARATYKKRPSNRNMMTLLETQANLWFNRLILAPVPLSKLNLEALMKVKDQSDRWLQDLVNLATGRVSHTSFAVSSDKDEVEE